ALGEIRTPSCTRAPQTQACSAAIHTRSRPPHRRSAAPACTGRADRAALVGRRKRRIEILDAGGDRLFPRVFSRLIVRTPLVADSVNQENPHARSNRKRFLFFERVVSRSDGEVIWRLRRRHQ